MSTNIIVNPDDFARICGGGKLYRSKAKTKGLSDFSQINSFRGLQLEEFGALFRLLIQEAHLGKSLEYNERGFCSVCMISTRKWRRIAFCLEKEGYIHFEASRIPGFKKLIFDFESPFLIIKLLKMFERQPIPHTLRLAVYKRDGFACVECGADTHLTCDHIIAVTSGGATILENLRTLCLPCNASKGARNGGAR